MKVTAKMNFRANGIRCVPGDTLTNEQTQRIAGLLDDLKAKGLVEITHETSVVETDATNTTTIPITEGFGPVAAVNEIAEAQEEKPRKRKKR